MNSLLGPPSLDPPEPPSLGPPTFFGLQPSTGDAFGQRKRSWIRERLGAFGAAVLAFLAKIKTLLLLATKVKLLTTSGTALVSVAAYSLLFGWPFAAGLVVLIFVHEMGHVAQLRREGIKATAPMFIPFMGAVISARSLGDNALAEARVGLAGPLFGSLGALIVAVIGYETDSNLLMALAYMGFFLNLFNLLPTLPLDGGRAMAAVAPWAWFLGLLALVPLLVIERFDSLDSLVLIVILALGGRETLHRWRQLRARTLESAAYYRVSKRGRTLIGLTYFALVALLVVGMQATYVASSSGHA